MILWFILILIAHWEAVMSQFLRDLCAGLCLICVCGVTFFFHLRLWIITTWAIIFLNHNLASYLKHLFSLWHGSMLLVLSNVPFFFLNYLFDFFFLAVSKGLQFINWKRGHSDRENQSKSRTEIVDVNLCYSTKLNVEYKTNESWLVIYELWLDRTMVRSLQPKARSLHSKVRLLHQISYFATIISYFATNISYFAPCRRLR